MCSHAACNEAWRKTAVVFAKSYPILAGLLHAVDQVHLEGSILRLQCRTDMPVAKEKLQSPDVCWALERTIEQTTSEKLRVFVEFTPRTQGGF